jgi:hypothetical protein
MNIQNVIVVLEIIGLTDKFLFADLSAMQR